MKNRNRHTRTDPEPKPRPGPPALSRRGLFQAAAVMAPPLLGALAPSAGAAEQSKSTNPAPRGGFHSWSSIRQSLHQHAARVSVFDTHEHIVHQDHRLREPPDFFLLLSHYTSNDLLSAGIPLSEWNATGGLQDHNVPLEQRWKILAPYWQFTRTTGYGRCMLIAARDLFGVEDINERTYRTISERITTANRDPQWYHTVLKVKGGIHTSLLDDLTTGQGEPLNFDPKFFRIITRMDYIVTAGPETASGIEKSTGVAIGNLAELEKALATAIENAMTQALRISPDGLAGIKCALAYRRSLAFDKVARPDAEKAFADIFSQKDLGQQEQATHKTLQDYMMRRLVEQCGEHHLPMQIHTGMQAGNQNRVAWTNPSLLSNLLDENRNVRFDIFHGGYPYLGEQATICKNNPNCYADLCWLHIISPSMARFHLHQLIDTVPANKILGFGGDFLHVEGAYAHCKMAREITADVLADKVEAGDLPEEHAAFLLERILYGNGKDLFTRS